MTKEKITPTLVLTLICLVVALLLAGVNALTKDVILEQQNAETNKALTEVLPNGKNFEKIDLSDYQLPATLTEAYKADGGYVFKLTVTGYKPGLVIMVGVDSEGKVAGHKHIDGSETYGADDIIDDKKTYLDYTLGTLFPIEEVEIEASGTKTSEAYYNAIKGALESYTVLTGGTVDMRDPEVILQENCNTALGTTGKTFALWFTNWTKLEEAKIYVTDNGVVVNLGENFVGYNAAGEAQNTSGVATEDLAKIQRAYAAYTGATKVDLSLYTGINERVTGVYTTEDGEYLVSLSTKGFEWAKENIIIELVVDADGKIESCVTVSHAETGGYGADCGKPEYYEQYVGKDATNYGDVDKIVGVEGSATQTSNGYQEAIKQAFKAIEKIEGGVTE